MIGRANPLLTMFATLAAAALEAVLAGSIPSAVFPEVVMKRTVTSLIAYVLMLLWIPCAQAPDNDAPVPDDSSTAATTDSGPAEDGCAEANDSRSASAVKAGASTVPVTTAHSSSAEARPLITMNLQNVDIPVLAKFMSEITGRNFVVGENVRGKVSIISPTHFWFRHHRGRDESHATQIG